MKPAARVQAAIDILADISARERPAAAALTDWGRSHRFAGSGDRAAIGDLVYDALRRKASAGSMMGAQTPRGVVLGTLRLTGNSAEAIAQLVDGSLHAPAQLSNEERRALEAPSTAECPDHVRGDFPEWLGPSLARGLGASFVAEMQALAVRAPLDLRTNSLKTTRPVLLQALAQYTPQPTRWSPLGIRIEPQGVRTRIPNVEAAPEFASGWFEVQDEGSQIAALLTGVHPGMRVADVCAGAGGKTLALAAMMENAGSIHAYDADAGRLRAIHPRIARAGTFCVNVLPAGETSALAALADACDVVLVDAPCTGSGTWRRAPDTKWRLTPEMLAQRCQQQRAVLELAKPLVRPGGRLVYVTCSILPEENSDQVAAFLERHGDFRLMSFGDVWAETVAGRVPSSGGPADGTLQLTPRAHGTDGFFVAVMQRRS